MGLGSFVTGALATGGLSILASGGSSGGVRNMLSAGVKNRSSKKATGPVSRGRKRRNKYIAGSGYTPAAERNKQSTTVSRRQRRRT